MATNSDATPPLLLAYFSRLSLCSSSRGGGVDRIVSVCFAVTVSVRHHVRGREGGGGKNGSVRREKTGENRVRRPHARETKINKKFRVQKRE